MSYRRIASGFAIIAGAVLLLGIIHINTTWRREIIPLPSLVRPASSQDINPNAWRHGREKGQFKEPKVEVTSPYPIGRTKAAGSNYTRGIVLSRLQEEDVSWVQTELQDLLSSELLEPHVYTMQDLSTTLGVGPEKGHEAMVYLSYIIDHYDELPDIVIFLHAHRFAWHNNMLLDKDASLMIRHLSPERVTRDGYMNLRCHWDPGCPEWLHPGETVHDKDRTEQEVLGGAWEELFPGEPMPNILAQPCCAQFAVSRERVLSIPRERFVSLRDWVVKTELNDFLSGRVLEYTWQYIFTSLPLHCPSMSVCYCDGYGICFGDPEKFDYYFELDWHLRNQQQQLNKTLTHKQNNDTWYSMIPESSNVMVEYLKAQIVRAKTEMGAKIAAALELGMQPEQRANEAGREWKEGDGF